MKKKSPDNDTKFTQKMYIGPSVKSLGLIRNQVYMDGIPGQVRAALTLIPEIEELIVGIDEINEATRKVQTKGEHLHHVYEQVEQMGRARI